MCFFFSLILLALFIGFWPSLKDVCVLSYHHDCHNNNHNHHNYHNHNHNHHNYHHNL